MPSLNLMPPIRAARRDELDALVTLEEASFAGDRLSRRQYRHHLKNPAACVLVIGAERAMTASAVLLFRRGAAVARLHSLAVAASARGHGLGRKLLQACERQALARRCTRLRLEVRADNRAAQTLYERNGYLRRGQRPGYYADGSDAWLYEKVLRAQVP
jgi:[ribosomal protein S18]-alanine N-acetyltransferase